MTLHMPFHVHSNASQLRLAAMALLAIPAAVLLLFAIGEMVGGDSSGAQHLPEAALLFVFMVLAWRHPWGAGIALLALSSALFVAWVALIVFGELGGEGDNSVLAWLAAGAVLFLPPLLAGALLVRAGRMLWAPR